VADALRESMSEGLSPRMARLFGVTPDRFLGVPLVMSGTIIGVLIVLRPVGAIATEHDEWLLSALADQAAVALEKTRLGEIAEFREQLMAIVGHDLRTPLSTILMAAQLLTESEGLGAPRHELVRKITRSASLATRLIEQLLDLTRSRLGGGMPVDLGPVDLRAVCQQVAGEVETTHPDRPLRVQLAGDAIGLWDHDRLYQLVANLVGNAIHHGQPRTPIELRIDGNEAEVVIEVANQGPPIPPAILPFIFDPFRKKRDEHPSRSHGLGLGLFICHQIVRSHRGSIAADSGPEITTFRVHLPRGAVAARSAG
jgi:signal transduction histidine kinase